MPTNANTFNSRVTSEALEKKFRDVFPAQGGAELVQDLYASGVVQPVIDFSSVAEGSVLPPELQQAWDFSTGNSFVTNTTTTIINNPGFWKIDLVWAVNSVAAQEEARIRITDGLTNKTVWDAVVGNASGSTSIVTENSFIVFVRSGDSVTAFSDSTNNKLNVWYRQIADVNGNLVNPLGFTFS